MSQTNYERQTSKLSGKSKSLTLFLFLINLYVILLIIDIPQSDNFMLFCLISAFLIVLFKFIQTSFRNKVGDDDIRDISPLISKYLKINKRYLLVSIIGIILAVTVISQIILLTSAPIGNIYQEALDDGEVPLFQITEYKDVWSKNPNPTQNFFIDYKDQIMNKFSQSASNYEILTKNLDFGYYFGFSLPIDLPLDEDYDIYIEGNSITIDQFNILQNFPTFPQNLTWNDNFTLLTLSENYFNGNYFIPINETLFENLNTTLFTAPNDRSNNFTIDFDGWWKVTEEDFNYGWNIGYDFTWQLGNGIFVSNSSMPNFFETKQNVLRTQILHAFIDIDSLKGLEVDYVLSAINSIMNEVNNFIIELGFNSNVYSNAEWRIYDAQFDGTGLRFLLLVISLPMLAIALYLVYFSLNLVELRKQNLVSIMKIRGISSNQLRSMMISDALVGAFIATIFGMIISLPWTHQIITQNNIFGEESSLFIPNSWYYRMPIIGLILSLDLNIFSILTISRTTVEEGEASEETKIPFWKRFYLDVVFTAIGISFWLALRYLTFEEFIYNALIFFSPWTLPILVIGIPLLVSRFYSNFLTFISDFLWLKEGNLIALATRNMRNNKFSASKLAVLLIIGMMFSFVALGVPGSFSSWGDETTYYNVGADFSVQGVQMNDTNKIGAVTNLTEISNIAFVQKINLQSRSTLYNQISILAIDPNTYSDTAFWDSSYANDSLDNLMKIINDKKILIQSDQIQAINWAVGSNSSIQHEEFRINEQIGGTFTYWPNLVTYLYIEQNSVQTLHVVMHIDTLSKYIENEVSTVLYAKAHNGANHTMLHENLTSIFSNSNDNVPQPRDILIEDDFGVANVKVQSVVLIQENLFNSPEVLLMFELFDILLIITIISSIIGVGYFTFISLSERKREIGVFRAVGMVSKQIFVLLVVESIILIMTSIGVGIIAGSFISSNLFLLITSVFGSTLPPIKLRYPMITTSIFVFSAIILSILAAAIPVQITANKQTGSILRAD